MTSVVACITVGLLAVSPAEASPPAPEAPNALVEPSAPPGRQAPEIRISRYIRRVAEVVKATDEQVEQLEAIASQHVDAVRAARSRRDQIGTEHGEKIGALRRQMREARRSGDREGARRLHTQLAEVMGHSPGDLMRQTHDKIAAILSPEQQTVFEEMVAERRPRRQARHARRGPEGRGRGGEKGAIVYRFISRVAEAVEATDKQERQLKEIAAQHVRAFKAAEAERLIAREEHREELKALQDQLRVARRAGDTEEIEALHEQIQAILGPPPLKALQETQGKISAVLTDEQKPAFDTLVAEFQERISERGDRPGRHRKSKGKGKHHRGRAWGDPAGPPEERP